MFHNKVATKVLGKYGQQTLVVLLAIIILLMNGQLLELWLVIML